MRIASKMIVAGGLIMLGLGLYWMSADQKVAEEFVMPPTNVEVTSVESDNWPISLQAYGHLRAAKQGVVSTALPGTILEILFEDGQRVLEGDILYQLDNRQALTHLRDTQAALELAQANLKRQQEIFSAGLGAQQALEQAKLDWQAKKNAQTSAQLALDHMAITAPFDGIMGANRKSIGDYVAAAEQLSDIVDNSILKVDYRVPSERLGQLKVGQAVTLKVEAYPEILFNGKVDFIASIVEQDSLSVQLNALIDNLEGKLVAGMGGTLKQILGQRENVLSIPEEALVNYVGGQQVFRVIEGQVESIEVGVGDFVKGRVEVTSGLQAGDIIVLEGQLKLHDGSTIVIVEENAE